MLGLYVHVPFCSVKCFYCDFAAFSGQGRLVGRYLSALEAEAGLFPAGPRPGTLYVGGGTPSELKAPEIAELFALIGRAYPGAGFAEATFEANPESLDAPKLEVLREAGVGRLSLGLQTLDEGLLKSIGRRHGAREFLEVYGEARRQGGFAINVDLMYGLPGQTLEHHRRSLAEVLALSPEHVSLYGLQVEDRTLFSRRQVANDEGLEREMFEESLDRLLEAGYHHYEISNFARPGFESRHNRIYWENGEYIGLGCGAASHLGGLRSMNTDRLEAYCRAVESGRRPLEETERLEGRERLGETAWLGLRLIDGFRPGPALEAAFASEWGGLERRGLLLRSGERVRLSREGIFLANQVFREFVAPLGEAVA